MEVAGRSRLFGEAARDPCASGRTGNQGARNLLSGRADNAAQALDDAPDAAQRATNGDTTSFTVDAEGTSHELHRILRDEVYRIYGECCAATSRLGAG